MVINIKIGMKTVRKIGLRHEAMSLSKNAPTTVRMSYNVLCDQMQHIFQRHESSQLLKTAVNEDLHT
jgi:hypothetical protein